MHVAAEAWEALQGTLSRLACKASRGVLVEQIWVSRVDDQILQVRIRIGSNQLQSVRASIQAS